MKREREDSLYQAKLSYLSGSADDEIWPSTPLNSVLTSILILTVTYKKDDGEEKKEESEDDIRAHNGTGFIFKDKYGNKYLVTASVVQMVRFTSSEPVHHLAKPNRLNR